MRVDHPVPLVQEGAVWGLSTGSFVHFTERSRALDAQRRNGGGNVNWALHNLDLAGTRYSTLDQVNARNVKTLRRLNARLDALLEKQGINA